MSQEVKRLLLQFQQLMGTVNQEIINPEIEELSVDSLRPLVTLVARSRAVYLKELYELSKRYDGSDQFPTEQEMKKLKKLRTRYIDLVDGAQSFEISIQRGYLDIKG